MKKHDIPKPILEQIENELLSHEDLLWVGQPNPLRINANNSGTGTVLAGIIALELAAFIGTLVVEAYALAMLILLALILTATFGAIAQQYITAKNTIYAITNQRALIISNQSVETFGKADLQSIIRKKRHNGRGDIIFRHDTQKRFNPATLGLMLHRQDLMERGFFGIDNPEQVEALLLQTFGEGQAWSTNRLEDAKSNHDNLDVEEAYQETVYKKQKR